MVERSRGVVACWVAAGLYLGLGFFSFYKGNIPELWRRCRSGNVTFFENNSQVYLLSMFRTADGYRLLPGKHSYEAVHCRQVEMKPLLNNDSFSQSSARSARTSGCPIDLLSDPPAAFDDDLPVDTGSSPHNSPIIYHSPNGARL